MGWSWTLHSWDRKRLRGEMEGVSVCWMHCPLPPNPRLNHEVEGQNQKSQISWGAWGGPQGGGRPQSRNGGVGCPALGDTGAADWIPRPQRTRSFHKETEAPKRSLGCALKSGWKCDSLGDRISGDFYFLIYNCVCFLNLLPWASFRRENQVLKTPVNKHQLSKYSLPGHVLKSWTIKLSNTCPILKLITI